MSKTALLLTDRTAFERKWRPPLERVGLQARAVAVDALADAAVPGGVVVIDGGAEALDEDELLASVGLARALKCIVAVVLPADDSLSGIEEVLEDLCPGLVTRGDADGDRLAAALSRRSDNERARRFEYLTVSPRPNELLAILADGTAALMRRPVGEGDDGSEVSSIALGNDAETATLQLGSGREVTVRAAAVALSSTSRNGAVNGANGTGPIDGARLGARLRELRVAAGLTQAELARRTGIHRPNIARVEAGRHTPSLETLARLATAIGVPTTHVLADE